MARRFPSIRSRAGPRSTRDSSARSARSSPTPVGFGERRCWWTRTASSSICARIAGAQPGFEETVVGDEGLDLPLESGGLFGFGFVPQEIEATVGPGGELLAQTDRLGNLSRVAMADLDVRACQKVEEAAGP